MTPGIAAMSAIDLDAFRATRLEREPYDHLVVSEFVRSDALRAIEAHYPEISRAGSYSLSELEPRLFSFNNPVGACTACDGLGVDQFFDPERVVVHAHLSLAGGAMRGWDRRNT